MLTKVVTGALVIGQAVQQILSGPTGDTTQTEQGQLSQVPLDPAINKINAGGSLVATVPNPIMENLLGQTGFKHDQDQEDTPLVDALPDKNTASQPERVNSDNSNNEENNGRFLLDAIKEYAPFSMRRLKRNLGFLDILHRMVRDKLLEFKRTKSHVGNKSKRAERRTNRNINKIVKAFLKSEKQSIDQLEIQDLDALVELDRILQDEIPKVKEALQNGEDELADVDPHATMDPWLVTAVDHGLMSEGVPPFGPNDLVPFDQEHYRLKLNALEEMHLFAEEGLENVFGVYFEDMSFNSWELGRLQELYSGLQRSSNFLLREYQNEDRINVEDDEDHDQLIQQMVAKGVARVQEKLREAENAGYIYLLEAAQDALDLYEPMQMLVVQ